MWSLRRKDPGTDQSKAALQNARETLREVTDRHEEVTEVAQSLRRFRKENHFSDHLTRIMTEGRQ